MMISADIYIYIYIYIYMHFMGLNPNIMPYMQVSEKNALKFICPAVANKKKRKHFIALKVQNDNKVLL